MELHSVWMLDPCFHLDWSGCGCQNDLILNNHWNGLDQNVPILVPHDHSKIPDGFNLLPSPEEKWIWSNQERIRCPGVRRAERSTRSLFVVDCGSWSRSKSKIQIVNCVLHVWNGFSYHRCEWVNLWEGCQLHRDDKLSRNQEKTPEKMHQECVIKHPEKTKRTKEWA